MLFQSKEESHGVVPTLIEKTIGHRDLRRIFFAILLAITRIQRRVEQVSSEQRASSRILAFVRRNICIKFDRLSNAVIINIHRRCYCVW